MRNSNSYSKLYGMKKLLLSISMTLIAATSFGQMIWNLDFENTSYLNRVIIDTSSNPNNIWQIGHPNKTIFTSAYSSPNVIATDTLNFYPINDTSSFTIIHVADAGWQFNYIIYIDGWYFVNSDSLTDYGYIQFSPDHGNSWYYVDSSMNHGCCFSGPEELPTFTGNSLGWQHFHYCLCTSTPVNPGDTVLYRFTFVSDSVQTNKDGLMFDDLQFWDMVEGIYEIQNDNLISISPIPTSDELRIQKTKVGNNQTIQIRNYTGQIIYENKDFKGETIDTRQLLNGIYLLIYSDTKYFCVKRFVIQH